ncbi:hypothetical protein [Mycoplasma crocodyli]|uniref:Uncharacterized protein n=1 Tax=Mycoplasma crocodyli (strain ATCC 51981 / MP145) TaxID=512564 RepID=D5E5E5_MYCCM|nr:hypothetical protein [Mycoplasma crocodyli]ADE20029.1 hypothetical protein MCRO_0350 [Mycoplasma crocodyli MP145]
MKRINKKGSILLASSTIAITSILSGLSVSYTTNTATERQSVNLALARNGTRATISGFSNRGGSNPEKAIDGVSFNNDYRWISSDMNRNIVGGANYKFELHFNNDYDVRALDLVFSSNHILNMDIQLYNSSGSIIKEVKSLHTRQGNGDYGLINYQFPETIKNVRKVSLIFNKWNHITGYFNYLSIYELRVFGSTINAEYYDEVNQLTKDLEYYTKETYDSTLQEINNKKNEIQGWINSNTNIEQEADKNGIKTTEQLGDYNRVMNDIKNIKDKLISNKVVVLNYLLSKQNLNSNDIHPSSLSEYKTKLGELMNEVNVKGNIKRSEVKDYQNKADLLNSQLKNWKEYLNEEISRIKIEFPELYTANSKTKYNEEYSKLKSDVNAQFPDTLKGSEAKAMYEHFKAEIIRIKTTILKTNREQLISEIDILLRENFDLFIPFGANNYKKDLNDLKTKITQSQYVDISQYDEYKEQISLSKSNNLITYKKWLKEQIDTKLSENLDEFTVESTNEYTIKINAIKSKIISYVDDQFNKQVSDNFIKELGEAVKLQKSNKIQILANVASFDVLGKDPKYTIDSKAKYKVELDKIIKSINETEKISKISFIEYTNKLNNLKSLLVTNQSQYKSIISLNDFQIYTEDGEISYKLELNTLNNKYDKEALTANEFETAKSEYNIIFAKLEKTLIRNVLKEQLKSKKITDYNKYEKESAQSYENKYNELENNLNNSANQFNRTNFDTEKSKITNLASPKTNNEFLIEKVNAYRTELTKLGTEVSTKEKAKIESLLTNKETLGNDKTKQVTQSELETHLLELSKVFGNIQNFKEDAITLLTEKIAEEKINRVESDVVKFKTELESLKTGITSKDTYSKIEFEDLKVKIKNKEDSILTYQAKIQDEIKLALKADYSELTIEAKNKLLKEITDLETSIKTKNEIDYKKPEYAKDKETLTQLLNKVETNKKVIDDLFLSEINDPKLTEYTSESVSSYKATINSIKNEYSSIKPITVAHVLEIKNKINGAKKNLELYKTSLLKKVREEQNSNKDYYADESVKSVFAELEKIYKKVNETTTPYLVTNFNDDIAKIAEEVAKLKTNKSKLITNATEIKDKVNAFITENSLAQFNPKIQELINEINGLDEKTINLSKYNEYMAKLNEVKKLLETYQESLTKKIDLLKKVDAATNNPASSTEYVAELDKLRALILADDKIDKSKNDQYEKQITDANKLLKTNVQMLKELINQKQKADYPTKSSEAVDNFKKYLEELDKTLDKNTTLSNDRYNELLAEISDKESKIKSNKEALSELSAMLDGINHDIYTSDSVSVFNTGVVSFKNEISTLEDATNEQFNALKSKFDKLMAVLVTNKTDLLNKVQAQKMNNGKEQEYTTASISQFYRKVEELEKEINNNKEEVFKQTELSTWNDKINKLKESLITNNADLTRLLKEEKEKFETNKSKYSKEIQDAYSKEANRIESEITKNPVIKWDMHKTIADDIINLDGILSNNKDALLAEIDKILNDNYDLYTASSTEQLLKDIAAYKEKVQKMTSIAKVKFDEFVSSAKSAKESVLMPNKTELLNKYNEFNNTIKEEFYTRPSVIKFDQMLKAIKPEIDNKNPGFTKAEYEEMIKKMNGAVAILETNKDWLNKYIEAETNKKFDEYTNESVNTYKENLKSLLTDINKNENVDKTQASNYSDEITKANHLLRTFKEGLLSKINQIDNQHQSKDYNKRAYTRFKRELDKKRDEINKSTSYTSPEYDSELLKFKKIEDLLKNKWTPKDILVWTGAFASGIGAIVVLLLLIAKKRKS